MDRLKLVDCFGLDPDDNLLIEGKALDSLRALERSTSYANGFLGSVKLAYLDPPFNTGQNFKHYRDNLDHFTWNTHLKKILALVHRFLSDDGSLWLHLNDSEQHRGRLLLDEVFGTENFLATVIWERTRMPRLGGKPFATRHDYLHVYRKTAAFQLGGRVDRAIETHWNSDETGSTDVGTGESRTLFGDPFSTPKPEKLLARIITLATAPGDLVLDCFAGSGTTPAVAHKLGRRWIAIEAESDTVGSFLKPRMEKVVAGTDHGGISPSAGWAGGGGFTHLALEGSAVTAKPPVKRKMKKQQHPAPPGPWSDIFSTGLGDEES